MKRVTVRGDYITLGQLLKLEGAIDSGGDVRDYLSEHAIQVNGEREERRGRKLRAGDSVTLASGAVILLQ